MERHLALLRGMKMALQQAKMAGFRGEVPIGCSILAPLSASGNWKLVGAGRNAVEQRADSTAHAELEAIRRSQKSTGDWRLENAIMCTTVEPCTMCLGASQSSRLDEIAYAACSPRFGALEGKLSKVGRAALEKHPSYKTPMQVTGGILREESAELMDRFFKGRRLSRKDMFANEVDTISQGLVLSKDRTHILLKKHLSGAYKDRFTGFLDVIEEHKVPEPPNTKAIIQLVQQQTGGRVSPANCLRIEHHATLEFYECDLGSLGLQADDSEDTEKAPAAKPSLEHQFVLSTNLEPCENVVIGDCELTWFHRNQIPFEKMPADDEFWYSDVLFLDDALGSSTTPLHVHGYFCFDGKELLCYDTELIRVRESGLARA